MLYIIAHFLRDKMSWLWGLIDIVNSWLFFFRYGKKLKLAEVKLDRSSNLLRAYRLRVIPIREVSTIMLVEFFKRQPKEAFKFFKPHRFDVASIMKLQKNKSFLGYVLVDEYNVAEFQNLGSKGTIVGYCFNRSFFHGKGFRGRMVDIDYRGRGLGTLMNKILNDVGFSIGLRLFETVNKENMASYKSAMKASKVIVVKELPNNDLYLEILKN